MIVYDRFSRLGAEPVFRERHVAQFARIGEEGPARGVARLVRDEPGQARVVQREDLILRRLHVEQLLHVAQLVGHLGGEVVGLRPVFVDVVSLPTETVHDVRRRLRQTEVPRRIQRRRRGHPAVMIDGALAEHLEVLRRPLAWRGGVVPRIDHAHAFDRLLGDAVDHHRLRQASRFQNRRRDVDHMVELIADATGVLDARRPGHGHAVAGATEIGCDLLGPFEGRVPGPGPAHRVVGIGLVGAPGVVELHVLFDRRVHGIRNGELVVETVERAFRARAVVAADVDDECIVEFASVRNGLDHATDFGVGISEVRRIDVGLPDVELLRLGRQ